MQNFGCIVVQRCTTGRWTVWSCTVTIIFLKWIIPIRLVISIEFLQKIWTGLCSYYFLDHFDSSSGSIGRRQDSVVFLVCMTCFNNHHFCFLEGLIHVCSCVGDFSVSVGKKLFNFCHLVDKEVQVLARGRPVAIEFEVDVMLAQFIFKWTFNNILSTNYLFEDVFFHFRFSWDLIL